MFENMANLYAIVKTAEALEKAYARDGIAASDYKQEMYKLISHYKSAREATRDSVPNIQQFLADHQLVIGAGFSRLEQGFPSLEKTSNSKIIAEVTQNFITLMDSLKLNMAACDQLQPLLNDLVESIDKCPLDGSFNGNVKLKDWLKRLNSMAANHELDADSSRQFLFDLETSYNAFHKALK